MDPLIEKSDQDPQIVEDETTDSVGYVEDDGSPSGCQLYGPTVKSGPDGLPIIIPVECNQFYFDKGDPDPTRVENPRTDRPDTHLKQISRIIANES
jgi:hypothetical protein